MNIRRGRNYLFSLNDNLNVDASLRGNEARFINDYHGIAERPNAVFEEYFVKCKKGWEARMGVWVDPKWKEGVGKGDEILVSYGRGFWRARRAMMEGSHAEWEGEGEYEGGGKDRDLG